MIGKNRINERNRPVKVLKLQIRITSEALNLLVINLIIETNLKKKTKTKMKLTLEHVLSYLFFLSNHFGWSRTYKI